MIHLPDGSVYKPPAQEYTVKAFDLGSSGNNGTIQAIVSNGSQHTYREAYWYLYRRHPWIRTCVDIIAEAVSAEGYLVQKVDGENAQSYDAEADNRVTSIHAFFRNAFPGSSQRRELNKAAIDNNIFGVAYWRKKRAGKIVVALERLDPRNVTKDNSGSYILKLPNQSINDAKRIDADDIIEIGNGIGDPLEGGLSPLESLDMTIATDMSIRKHRNSFFENAATAGTVLINTSSNQKYTEAAVEMFKAQKTGARNAYTPIVLTGEWQVQSINNSGKNDFDFVKASGISREEVMMVYRVPPGKLFINSGSLGSAGKSEDDATFQQNAVLPLEERIYEAMTLSMLQTEWGITDLEIVPKRRASLRIDMFQAAETLVKFGGTANEARALVNLQPLADEGMDKALFITSRQPVLQEEIDADAAAQQQKNNVATAQQQKDDKT